jgi:hypothetical protein
LQLTDGDEVAESEPGIMGQVSKRCSTRVLDAAACRVLLQHEGLPLRGGAAADLPAAVREVYETYCQGPGQIQFWQVRSDVWGGVGGGMICDLKRVIRGAVQVESQVLAGEERHLGEV